MWVNLHKKRIKDKDYYYHTVRNSEGGTKTLYLGSDKKVAKKKAKELGLTHKESNFSWFKHGPFFLLALSLLMLSLVGFLTLFFVPDYEVVQLGPSKDLSYEYEASGRGVGVDIISGFDSSVSVEITVVGSDGEETYTEEVEPGDSRVVVPSEVGKVEEVFVDVVGVEEEETIEDFEDIFIDDELINDTLDNETEEVETFETRSSSSCTGGTVGDISREVNEDKFNWYSSCSNFPTANSGYFDSYQITSNHGGDCSNHMVVCLPSKPEGCCLSVAPDVAGSTYTCTYVGICNGQSSAPATIYVETYENSVPFAEDATYVLTLIQEEITFALGGEDPDGGQAKFYIETLPELGILTKTNGDGIYEGQFLGTSVAQRTLIYTRDEDAIGDLEFSDSFTFKVCDPFGCEHGQDYGTVSFELTNSPPEGEDFSITTDEDVLTEIHFADYVTDVEFDSLSIEIITSVENGVITDHLEDVLEDGDSTPNAGPGNSEGTYPLLYLNYLPNENYYNLDISSGENYLPDSFQYRLYDGEDYSETYEVSIIVHQDYDSPIFESMSYTPEEVFVEDELIVECEFIEVDQDYVEGSSMTTYSFYDSNEEVLQAYSEDNSYALSTLNAHDDLIVSCKRGLWFDPAYWVESTPHIFEVPVSNSIPIVEEDIEINAFTWIEELNIDLNEHVSDLDGDPIDFYDSENNDISGGIYTITTGNFGGGVHTLEFSADDGYDIVEFDIKLSILGFSTSHEGEYYDDSHRFTAIITDLGQDFEETTCELEILDDKFDEIIYDIDSVSEEGVYSYSTQFTEYGDGEYSYTISCEYEGEALSETREFTVNPYQTILTLSPLTEEIYHTEEQIEFVVSYTKEDGTFVEDADCSIRFNDGLPLSMVSSGSSYDFSQTFNFRGLNSFEINCDKLGYVSQTYSGNIDIWEGTTVGLDDLSFDYFADSTVAEIVNSYFSASGDELNSGECITSLGVMSCNSGGNSDCAIESVPYGFQSGSITCSVPGEYYEESSVEIPSTFVESPTTDLEFSSEVDLDETSWTLTGTLTFTNSGQGTAKNVKFDIYELGPDNINDEDQITGDTSCGDIGVGEECTLEISMGVVESLQPSDDGEPYEFWVGYSWKNNFQGVTGSGQEYVPYTPDPQFKIDYSLETLSFEGLDNFVEDSETIVFSNSGNVNLNLNLELDGEISEIITLSEEILEVSVSEESQLIVTANIPEYVEGKDYEGNILITYEYEGELVIDETIPVFVEVVPRVELEIEDNINDNIDLFEMNLGSIKLSNMGNIDLDVDISLSGDPELQYNIPGVQNTYFLGYGEETTIYFDLNQGYEIMGEEYNLIIDISSENIENIEKNIRINPWVTYFESDIVSLEEIIYVAPDQNLNLGKINIFNTAEQALEFSIEDDMFVDSETTIEANSHGELILEWVGREEDTYSGEFNIKDQYGNSVPFLYTIVVVDFDIEDVTLDDDQDLRVGDEIVLTISTTLEGEEHIDFELIEINVLYEEEELGNCEKTSGTTCTLPEIDSLLEQRALGLEVIVKDLDYNIIDSYVYEHIIYADTVPPTVEIYDLPYDVDPSILPEIEFEVAIFDNVDGGNLFDLTSIGLMHEGVEITEANFICSQGSSEDFTEIECALNIDELYSSELVNSDEIYTLVVYSSDNYGNQVVASTNFRVIDKIYNIPMEFSDANGEPLTGISLMFCLPDTEECTSFSTEEGSNSFEINEIGNSEYDISINYQGIVDFTFYDVDLSQLEDHSNFFSLDLFDYSETFIPESLVNNHISLYGVVVESEIFELGTINELHLDGTFFDEDTPDWYIGYIGWLTEHMNYVVCHNWDYEERACKDLESVEIISGEDYMYNYEEDVFSYVPPLVEEDLEGTPFSAYILSINTCGNGDQESWETETSCGADFADTYSEQPPSQPSGPSGGGGGGGSSGTSQPQQQLSESLIFSLNKIEKELFPGEEAYELIHISSITEDVTSLNVEVSGEIQDLITVPNSIEIATNPDLIVNIAIPDNKDNGLYEGKISFTRADVYSEVLVEIRVLNSEYNLLSLDIDPLQDSVSAGNDISIETQITNNGNDQNVDVSLELLDLEDTETPLSEDNYTVEVLFDYTELLSLSTPSDLDEGSYYVKGKAIHSGVTGRGTISMAQIEVIRSVLNATFLGIKFKYYLLLISIALLLVGGFYSLEFVRQKTRRYKGKVDIKTIPKSADRAAFVGKVAETPINSYIGLDKLQTHTLIAGATGSGKTVGAMDVVEEALDKKVSVIVFDPTGQWTGYLRKSTQTSMLDRYRFFGMSPKSAKAYEGNIYKITDPKEQIDIKEHIKPGKITVFVVKDLKPKEIDVLVTTTVEQVFRANLPETGKLKLLMVYDEVHRLLSKFGGSEAGLIQLERGAREFRKWGVGLVLISQVLSDFIGDIKANIGNEIQFRTRYENDLKRIRMKYGSKYSQSVIREAIGTGMYVNAGYNKGLPYFVSFRPLKHNTFGLPAEELNKYTEYNKKLDDMRWKISQLKKAKVDVFDVEIELKLIDEKLSQGNFNMVDMYLESMKPNLDKIVKKHRRKIGRKKVETFTSKELKEILDRAKTMRKKYLKKAPKDLVPVTKEAKEEMAKEVKKAKKKKTTKKLKKKKTKGVNNGKKTKNRKATKKRVSRKSKKPR